MTDEFSPSDAARVLELWHREIVDENADATPAYTSPRYIGAMPHYERATPHYETWSFAREFAQDPIPQYIHDEIGAEVDSIEAVYRYYSTTSYTHADARRRWFNDNRLNIQRLPRMPRDEEHTTMPASINTASCRIVQVAEALNARLCLRMRSVRSAVRTQPRHREAIGFVVPAMVGEDLCIFEFDTVIYAIVPYMVDRVSLRTPLLNFADMTPVSIRAWAANSAFRRIPLPQE
jgi:hypothetical protein